MVLFDIVAKRVVFGDPHFIYTYVKEGSPRCIMLEVDTTPVAALVPLTPCSGAGSGTVTSGGTTSGSAAVDAVWGSRGWTGCCNRGLILLGRHCCDLLEELLEEDIGC